MRTLIIKAILTLSAWAADAITAHGQVCEVKCENRGGTAFCVASTGTGPSWFLTAGHVIKQCRTAEIGPDGTWHKATVVFSYDNGEGSDVALLECSTYTPKTPYHLEKNSPPVGETVGFFGYPGGGPTRKTYARIREHRVGFMLIDAGSIRGESGGPVLNSLGRVVGIVTHTDGRVCVATNVETIRAAHKAGETGVGIGAGIGVGPGGAYAGIGAGGGYCTPYGCYPPRYAQPYGYQQPYQQPPVIVVQPPQAPAYPGIATPANPVPTQPIAPAEPPRTLPENHVPTPPATIPDSRLDDLEKRLAEIAGRPQFDDKILDGIAERFVTLDEKIAAIAARGNQSQASMNALESRIRAIESTKIPVQILDVDGNVLDTETYPLGAPIQLRLTPRPK